MVAVRLDAAVTDGQGFADGCPLVVFEPGVAPGQGQAGAGHQRDAEFGGPVPHPLSVAEVVGEVLVAEDGDDLAALGEDAGDLLEEVAAGVHVASAFVPGVVAVFADDDDGVDVEFIGPGVEGAADAGVEGYIVLLGQSDADVVFEDVVDVQGDQFGLGGEEAFVGGHALHELGDDDVGVGPGVVDGADGGDAQAVGHGGIS